MANRSRMRTGGGGGNGGNNLMSAIAMMTDGYANSATPTGYGDLDPSLDSYAAMDKALTIAQPFQGKQGWMSKMMGEDSAAGQLNNQYKLSQLTTAQQAEVTKEIDKLRNQFEVDRQVKGDEFATNRLIKEFEFRKSQFDYETPINKQNALDVNTAQESNRVLGNRGLIPNQRNMTTVDSASPQIFKNSMDKEEAALKLAQQQAANAQWDLGVSAGQSRLRVNPDGSLSGASITGQSPERIPITTTEGFGNMMTKKFVGFGENARSPLINQPIATDVDVNLKPAGNLVPAEESFFDRGFGYNGRPLSTVEPTSNTQAIIEAKSKMPTTVAPHGLLPQVYSTVKEQFVNPLLQTKEQLTDKALSSFISPNVDIAKLYEMYLRRQQNPLYRKLWSGE